MDRQNLEIFHLHPEEEPNVDEINNALTNIDKDLKYIDNNFIETVSSGIEASKKYKVSRGSISSCCNGNIKYVKNYIFKFH